MSRYNRPVKRSSVKLLLALELRLDLAFLRSAQIAPPSTLAASQRDAQSTADVEDENAVGIGPSEGNPEETSMISPTWRCFALAAIAPVAATAARQ